MTTSVNEIPRIHQWLYQVLSSDGTLAAAATGGFHRGRVPKGKAFPAVVFSFLTPEGDTMGSGAARIWMRARFIVKVIGETNSDLTLQTMADRIDAVLHATSGGASDIAIDYCIRRNPIYYQDDSVSDRVYTHLGGEYEVAARYAA